MMVLKVCMISRTFSLPHWIFGVLNASISEL
jgi:hypothetical protein